MKVALVYDRVNKWGGAEQVLLTLHELFPKAPLYTSVYNKKTASWANVFEVKMSFLQHFPFAKSSHELYALLMPWAFERFSFDGYDLVISVTSEAAKGIKTSGKTLHVCYCLTPTRYLWSGYADYFHNSFLRFISLPAIWYLRWWDKLAAKRPDAYIAISREVSRRIKKYYRRNATVVYPAMRLPKTKTISKTGKYFLVVSRLVPYKRVDIAIAACNELKVPLKVIGEGVEKKRLQRLAGPSVQLLGSLTQARLVGYYKNCLALLFPGKEDFGLAPVEAQAFGKPVIAYKAGGVLETIISGKTGDFFSPQTPKALVSVLQRFKAKSFNRKECVRQSQKFNTQMFKKEFMGQIKKLMKQHKANL